MPDLSAEDQKLVTLARATRARIQAAEGAAVRDTDGRTYAAATVDLPSLRLSAVQAVVAMAVASGSRGVDACVLLGDAPDAGQDLTEPDAAVLADFAGAAGVVVHLGDARGAIGATVTRP
ncbi:cytidine deaminase [Nocardioides humi]|uniref:Cytidine deaminase n=1 Tax=Nocardioides humi TaxID=449461 RepID=A0ABN2BQF1_9ACTN|nr:cytidine deaminase [Nocardioides humi]